MTWGRFPWARRGTSSWWISRRLELTGCLEDAAALPATVGIKNAVDYTVVAGNIVVKNGRLLHVDEESLAGSAGNAFRRYLNLGG